MARRISVLRNVDVGPPRPLDSKYDVIKHVSDNIELIEDYSAILYATLRYLGPHTSPPTTRVDGNPIQDADYYVDTVNNTVLYWDASGTSWNTMNNTAENALRFGGALPEEYAKELKVVIPHTGGGLLIAGGKENQIRSDGNYTVPLASSVEENSICVVTRPDTYKDSRPVLHRSGSDTFQNSAGVDTSINIMGSITAVLTSNGINRWFLDTVGL